MFLSTLRQHGVEHVLQRMWYSLFGVVMHSDLGCSMTESSRSIQLQLNTFMVISIQIPLPSTTTLILSILQRIIRTPVVKWVVA